ncbi:MAG: DUF3857 and transglutaminase domain-containing protein [Candidatus Omnitrophota bacterium]|nr:DUF3857 and transglutaminase domain-containing protein [Candidatus Omnitrophota bacterium]
MKKNILFIGTISFILLTQSLLFGETQKEAASFEDKHKDRDAIYLLFDVNIKINEDWSYVTKVNQKTKILKEEARALGEIQLGYDKERDKITVEQAYSITPDGKKHRYSKIQDLKSYDGYPVYSDSMTKVITLPEVNVGTVIERQTTRVSKGFPMEHAFWYSYDFNFDLPAKEINFTITWPKKLKIQYKAFSLAYQPRITETPKTITYSWKIQDVAPEEKAEEYLPLPTPESFKNTIEFSSIDGWGDLSKWYYALVQKNLKVDKSIETVVWGLIKDKSSIKDKTRAILEYVQDNFRYVSMSFGDNSLKPHPTDEVFRNKYGDCKDLSLLCMAMLKAAGINSYAALFNDEYSISEPKYGLPNPNMFDHVILLVEDKINGNFYVDPLLDGYDIGEFPLGYQGAYTFIINEQGGRFDRFPIFDEKRNSTKSVMNITLNEDGSALFDTEFIWELSSSIQMRDSMKAMDKEAEAKFYQKLDAFLISGGEMISRRIEGLDKKYGLVKWYAKYKRKDAFPLDGSMMIIDIPGYARGLSFTQKQRKNPIFFPGNTLAEEIATYKIPKGFAVSYLPNNISLKMGFFEMTREYKKQGDTITVTKATRFKRLQYPKEDYSKFKDFSDELPGKTQQRIVLKKTKSWQKKMSEIWAIIRQ